MDDKVYIWLVVFCKSVPAIGNENYGISMGRFLFAPGRDLFAYLIEVPENRVGILAEISLILAEHNADILYIHAYVDPEENRGFIFSILDVTNAKSDPYKLRDLLKEVKGVSQVFAIEPLKKGFVVDTIGFPVYVGSSRVLLMRDTIIKALEENLSKRIGKTAAEALIYHIGYEMGQGAAESHLKIAEALGIDDPLEIIGTISAPLFKAFGYGNVVFKEKERDLRCLMAKVYRGIESSDKSSSPLIRGMWAGEISRILGKEVVAREIECKEGECIEFQLKLREHRSINP